MKKINIENLTMNQLFDEMESLSVNIDSCDGEWKKEFENEYFAVVNEINRRRGNI